MALRAMSLPSSLLDVDSDSDHARFPHLRAQLHAIARQHAPPDTDPDDVPKPAPALLASVVALLDQEREDDLRALLQTTFRMRHDLQLEQNILDLMHKHRDDVAGVPFLFLTPTRRPISRPSSRPASPSIRLHPDASVSMSAPGSPLAQLFKRPHTPTSSPLAATAQPTNYINARPDLSPSSSPTLLHHVSAYVRAQYTASLPASPLSSPRLLNAKAHEFKPIQRPLSAASSTPGMARTETPSPDMWSHSPLRASNLAIAAPLLPEKPALARSSSLQYSRGPFDDDDDEEEDDPVPYGPFLEHTPYLPSVSDFDSAWPNTSPDDYYHFDHITSYQRQFDASHFDVAEPQSQPPPPPPQQQRSHPDADVDNDILTDGMTPFDVLSSVFGSTLAPSELEEGLAANGYDFERAMAWLIDRSLPPQTAPAPAATQQQQQARTQSLGNRVTLVSSKDNLVRGGRAIPPNGGRSVNGRPVQTGNRVCRYFVAGECLRADCRFSHDLERALCRFWLRGACAKHESCEFLHHLPKDVDMANLTAAINRATISSPQTVVVHQAPAPTDDFPLLGTASGNTANGNNGRHVAAAYHDPSRTRFAAAVKKPAAAPPVITSENPAAALARREAMGPHADSLHSHSAIIAPRSSQRIQLRAPSLLPTLPTGDSVNNMYMAYRSRALQLGGARNACLSRAADAWRRGDGAAAKRFSREGHDLNAKMSTEMTEACSKLVRERARLTEQAVRARDTNWSTDPGDRTSRGKPCGAGLGVCLGIASPDVGGGKLTPEERTEAVLDLHGLHANEATEVLERFLMALERENFYGLAFVIVGDEKHVGMQDPARGASRSRLAKGVREWVHRWGYPWNEREAGVICVDPLTHAAE